MTGLLISLPRLQVLSSASRVQSGAKLYVYQNNTTTPVSLFSDRAAGVSAANPVIADAAGRLDLPYTTYTGLLTLVLKDSSDVVQWTENDIEPLSAAGVNVQAQSAILQALADGGYSGRNRLINGGFSINQRHAATNADDTYCLDRWNVLTQSNAIAVTQLVDIEAGAPFGIRLTQSNASAQRIGLAQIIESADCRDLRSAVVTLAGRLRLSTASNVRYAIIEWTGTADSVTSDVVNDWTSTTYTPGNFFIASSVNILAVGQLVCAAATARDLTALSATCGSGMNNIIVFVWTESTLTQNGTLDLWKIKFEDGAAASTFDWASSASDMVRCQRFFYRKNYSSGAAASYVASMQAYSSSAAFGKMWEHPVAMRSTSPSVSLESVTHLSASQSTGSLSAFTTNNNALASETGVYADFGGASGLTAGNAVVVRANATTYIDVSAEL